MAALVPTSAKVVTASAASGGLSAIVPDIFIVIQAILPSSLGEDVRSAAARVIVAVVAYFVVHRVGWQTSDNRQGQEEPSDFDQVTTEQRIRTLEELAAKQAAKDEIERKSGDGDTLLVPDAERGHVAPQPEGA